MEITKEALSAQLNGLLQHIHFGRINLLENGVLLASVKLSSPAGYIDEGILTFVKANALTTRSGKPNQLQIITYDNVVFVKLEDGEFEITPPAIQAGGKVLIEEIIIKF